MKDRKIKILMSIFAWIIGINGLFSSAPAYSQSADNADHPESKAVSVLVNQIGYEVDGEKIAVVQLRDTLNIEPGQDFQLTNKSGKIVFSGKLVLKGRINEDTPGDWGARYWCADFSRFNTKGEYQVRIHVQNETYFSFYFNIGHNLIFSETILPSTHFFWFQRCGYEVTGLHAACHMDDAKIPAALGEGNKNASGGWHDAGDFNKYATISCRTVYALITGARGVPKQGLKEKNKKEILDEGLWGADWLLKMWQPGKGIIFQEVWNSYDYWGIPDKETDKMIGTADDRPFRGEGPSAMTAAALAAAARASGRQEYRQAAEDLWQGAVKSESNYPEDVWTKTSGGFPDYGENLAGRLVRRTADLLLADLELEALTGEEKYNDNAQYCVELLVREQKADGLWPSDIYSRTVLQGVPPASLVLYARAHPGTETSDKAINALRLWLNRIIQLTNNPFGLILWAEGVFFNPDLDPSWYVGQNSQYLSNAWALYLTAPLLGEPKATFLADRQIDWILGVNPYGLCMMEGHGKFNSPFYLHRWGTNQLRGSVPGAIPNGFCRNNPLKDRPYYDLYNPTGAVSYHTSEPWEPHNVFYIQAVSARAENQDLN